MNKFTFLHFIKVVAAVFFVSVGSKDVNAKVTTAGAAFAVKSPRVANNTVYADDSRVIIHAAQ